MTTVGEIQRQARRRPQSSGSWTSTMCVLCVVTWFAAVTMVITQAVSPNLLVVFYGMATILAAGIVWLFMALFGVIKYQAFAVSSILPVIVGLTFVVGEQRFPERAAWRVSKGALIDAAPQCVEHTQPQWIGVYYVESMHRSRDGACLFQIGDGIGSNGFAYFAPGTVVPERNQSEGATYYIPFDLPSDGSWRRYDYNYF
ncbi:hypothetical protein ACFWUP_01215 [Nocardia sp. NPDC058658]|uniref:hypothetical protein n=1 Tax=Nocardia sp. NPDC058658 TaxID=3346580 RepID=UPI0036607207